MQAISIVQGYFQVHGGSSKLFGALTEAENILVMKKASESTSQSRITNFLCPNIKNDQEIINVKEKRSYMMWCSSVELRNYDN